MQISRLRLSGFKSFVEPADLRIEPGLTGVVGPNGCGKSNLLEAIRWVMGENSPKSMRSGGMEDVIFAGTQQRPPRDFAEVVLYGADDRGDDLEVTRRIERGAGSAYRVNGQDVRAKDVSLTFADAATGAHSPALVSQGKIAQVIAAKPTERRQMLEEAAGIAGLHVRKRDAENKLRQTEKNLARLEDLMAGLDSQIASLRRQAKQAERYTKLTDAIQIAEARLLFARWREAAEAAEAARGQARQADERVSEAQGAADKAQRSQHDAAKKLADLREELADRRDDATAHGHRMASLTSQLEAAEQRLADLKRQRVRLQEDRGDADRLTKDAAEAIARLSAQLAGSAKERQAAEEQRPALMNTLDGAEQASRAAELALAKATADHAGVEAEWRVVAAALEQAQSRVARLDAEGQRLERQRDELNSAGDPDAALEAAKIAVADARERREAEHLALDAMRERKQTLQTERDAASDALATAKAELAGIEREHRALKRDRDARLKRSEQRGGQTLAIEGIKAKPGYERAVAAVLGRDAKSPIGGMMDGAEGRYWTGSARPAPVADNLAQYLDSCPEELAARLALVHCIPSDDGRTLSPGEWLVTEQGHLRRWDGFIARGEGAAEAAMLEAENRFKDLDSKLPGLIEAVERAQTSHTALEADASALQREIIAKDRSMAAFSDQERAALRAQDQAEAAKERMATRLRELAETESELADQAATAAQELVAAKENQAALPDPATGRGTLEAAQAKNDAARVAMQAANATIAAHDQALAVSRERENAQRSELSNWETRSGEAARRLADMAARAEEIEQEYAVFSAKPEGIHREIEQGDVLQARLAEALQKAESDVHGGEAITTATEATLRETTEALATAREARAGLAARAENEEARRSEMARISGERFSCPPPLLCDRFAFDSDSIAPAGDESVELEKLTASRERIGPVNLVAAEELTKIEEEHGASTAEQAELAEAVNRLRGSIGNLNREGRERLRAAFEQVDAHFRRLFTRLFEGGQAHLALIDSDDPLEAGLEIYAQPPGKRLQSLTLLSGGEQALTAVALIFALFLTNPAPICVLDEVDAPLDDANIDRFCDLLDAMTRETDTRYLIVTHNAVTMSRMHRLFGVTMIEQGVSRLVSVDLGAAEELVAAE